MHSRSHAILLRKIATIRDLQRVAAQAQTARAAIALQGKVETLAESEDAKKSGEGDWADFLAAPTLNVEMIPSWSFVLREQHDGVRLASDAVEGAKSELEQRTVFWHVAEERSSSAQELARHAVRDRARYYEEAALQEASDQHIQRGRAR